MTDEYRVALSYSNIQSEKGLPPVVSGVVSFEDQFEELQNRDLPSKRVLSKRVNSLYDMQTIFDDIAPYLAAHEISMVKKTDDVSQEIEKTYVKLLRILTKTQLRLLLGRTEYIIVTSPSAYNRDTKTWSYDSHFSPRFLDELAGLVGAKDKLIVADWTSRDRLLEIARILARLEYERLRSMEGGYIMSNIRRMAKSAFQILKITWNCPPLEEYSGFQVGPPALVLRKSDLSHPEYLYLERNLRVAFTPVVKFCRGSQDESRILPCKKADPSNPFGQFLIGSALEQCNECGGDFQCTQCLYRKPLCNGYEAKCGNTDFAGNICCGLFALYVTRFGRDLKVGTAIFSNIIGRLLEQGAGSALVIYPIEGIMNGYVLEKLVKRFLSARVEAFRRYGISAVYAIAPPRHKIVSDFLTSWRRDDSSLWREVTNNLCEASFECDGARVEIGEANHKVCNFIANYVEPPSKLRSRYLKPMPLFAKLDGMVTGYRGSFIFLDSGKTVDVKELQGYVVRGGSKDLFKA